MRRSLATGLDRLTAAALLLLCGTASARADGALDRGFGAGGVVRVAQVGWVPRTYGSGTSGVSGAGMAIQPDGKIVVILDQEGALDYRLARFQTNGQLDPAFGAGGVVTVPPFGLGSKWPEALAIAPDGKLVAAGWYGYPDSESLFLRFRADGSLDPSFAEFGTLHASLLNSGLTRDFLTGVAVTPEGRLVVCGRIVKNGVEHLGVVARLLPDGSIDLPFGLELGRTFFPIQALACAAGADVSVLGGVDTTAGRDVALRVGSTGRRDRNFADDSPLGSTLFADADLHATAARADGSVVQTFSFRGQTDRSEIQAFTADGDPDPDFGQHGRVSVGQGGARGNGQVQLRALGLLADGRILAAGSLAGELAVARLLPTGALDPTFGPAGEAGWLRAATAGLAVEMALGPDGAIAVLGRVGDDLLLARFVEQVCHPDTFTACLLDNRYQVTATYRTAQGERGHGKPTQLTSDSAVAWFFGPDNVEVTIKVLDGCALNDRVWVFASGLTNVEVDLRVRDSVTGQVRVYRNPLNTTFAPVLDTNAFTTCP